MSLPFVLIDFENVQPKTLDRLRPGSFRVKLFLGQHQSKLMLELVQKLQPFGSGVEYIQIDGNGADAVDFHIAFYIGQIAAREPEADFTIVSKDKGFDPLIRHLARLGIKCRRMPQLPEPDSAAPLRRAPSATPVATVAKAARPAAKAKPSVVAAMTTSKTASASTTRARAKAVVEHLRKSTKPAKLARLRASIKAWLGPQIDDAAVDSVLQSLQDSKKVTVTGAKVAYAL